MRHAHPFEEGALQLRRNFIDPADTPALGVDVDTMRTGAGSHRDDVPNSLRHLSDIMPPIGQVEAVEPIDQLVRKPIQLLILGGYFLVARSDRVPEVVGTALVHSAGRRRDDPNPKLLCDDRVATDGIWASGRQHSVQDRDANRSLTSLPSEAAGAQPRPDQRLVAAHCRFY
jgi:hypothetical protein